MLPSPLMGCSTFDTRKKAKLNQKVYTFKSPSNYCDGLLKIIPFGYFFTFLLAIIPFLEKRLTDEMLLSDLKGVISVPYNYNITGGIR
jgi:hypothetical protein